MTTDARPYLTELLRTTVQQGGVIDVMDVQANSLTTIADLPGADAINRADLLAWVQFLHERLYAIADRITPCSSPDIAGGYDMCPCRYGGAWPCPTTEAAWLANGLDPKAMVSAVIQRANQEMEARYGNPVCSCPERPAGWCEQCDNCPRCANCPHQSRSR